MNPLEGLMFTEMTDDQPAPDMCSCGNCGWKGPASNCETEMESDGWEYPEYQIHLCPVCEDGGCIDDYFYSGDEND